jgi:ornithine cyclodeaminase/alanine dehydrogenase-like protein (mu-crystallin family)
MTVPILTDHDLPTILTMKEVVLKIEDAFRAKSEGRLISPARVNVELGGGSLVFTVGAETRKERVMGFRVYNTFGGGTAHQDHVVAVFDHETGALKGIVVGLLIGALRTGAIGGAAVNALARADAKSLGILGTGLQARTQVEAAFAVRSIQTAKVFSPTREHREGFAKEMGAKLGVKFKAAETAEEVVKESEILIMATTSPKPVLNAAWVRPGTHVTTIGPKFQDECEVPMELPAKSALIVTDSLAQADHYTHPFFLTGTEYRNRMIELDEIISGKRQGRSTEEEITLFCSVGLAGTEVIVGNAFFQKLGEKGKK